MIGKDKMQLNPAAFFNVYAESSFVRQGTVLNTVKIRRYSLKPAMYRV